MIARALFTDMRRILQLQATGSYSRLEGWWASTLCGAEWSSLCCTVGTLQRLLSPADLLFSFADEPLQPSSSHNDSVPSYCKNDEGDIFLAAESWKPDVCTSCVCMDSVISCYSESCPSVSCERPVLRKGQCCPYCIGKTKKENPFSCPATSNSLLTAICPGWHTTQTQCRSEQEEQRCERCIPKVKHVESTEMLSEDVIML